MGRRVRDKNQETWKFSRGRTEWDFEWDKVFCNPNDRQMDHGRNWSADLIHGWIECCVCHMVGMAVGGGTEETPSSGLSVEVLKLTFNATLTFFLYFFSLNGPFLSPSPLPPLLTRPSRTIPSNCKNKLTKFDSIEACKHGRAINRVKTVAYRRDDSYHALFEERTFT